MRESESQWLRRQISQMEARLQTIETETSAAPVGTFPAVPTSDPSIRPPAPPAPGAPPAPDARPPFPIDRLPAGPSGTLPPPPGPTSLPSPPAVPAAPPRPAYAMPAAETLLKWAGLALLFLSAVFLVSTAIQRGWIRPELQLLGAAAIGGALIGGGLFLGQKREGWDVPLVAFGIAVLTACAGAGWQWLEIGDRTIWIVASFMVLGLGGWLTTRLDSPSLGATTLATTLIVLGVLAETVNGVSLLMFASVFAIEGVAAWIRRPALHLLTAAIALTGFGILAVVAAISSSQDLGPSLIVGAALTSLTLWAMPVVFTVRSAVPSPRNDFWQTITDRLPLSLPMLLGTGISLAMDLNGSEAGSTYLVIAGVALALAAGSIFGLPTRPTIGVTHLLGGMAALAVGTALFFEGPAVLAGLAAQSAALLFLIRRFDDPVAEIQALATSSLAAGWTLLRMLEAIDTDLPAVDDLMHLAVIVLLAVWGYLERRRTLGVVLAAAAYGGMVLWPLSSLAHLPQGQGLVSVVWAILGLAALALGARYDDTRAARLGLATLAVVTVKLLSVDLAAVDTFWRVLLFFVLGGTFLAASYRTGSVIRAIGGSGSEASRVRTEDPEDPDGPSPEASPASSPPPPLTPDLPTDLQKPDEPTQTL